jgi:hypothetical protein
LREKDVVGDPEPDEPAGGEDLGCREGDMECGSRIDDVDAFREEWRSVSIVLVLFRTAVLLGDTQKDKTDDRGEEDEAAKRQQSKCQLLAHLVCLRMTSFEFARRLTSLSGSTQLWGDER